MRTILLLLAVTVASISMAQVKSTTSRAYNWNNMIKSNVGSEERRLIREGGSINFDQFEIYAATLKPGKSVPSYTNDHLDELIILKEGELKMTVKEESKILEQGSVAFIMMDDAFRIENSGKIDALYYVLKFKSKSPDDPARGKAAGGSAFVNWNNIPFKATEKGGRRQFFERPSTTLSWLEMHVSVLNPGYESHPPHTHPEEEVIILLRGQAMMHIDGSEHMIAPGGLVFLDSMTPHAIKSTGNEPSEYFAFSLRGFRSGTK
jgi:(S)-ureidoglycine aminohydrolase